MLKIVNNARSTAVRFYRLAMKVVFPLAAQVNKTYQRAIHGRVWAVYYISDSDKAAETAAHIARKGYGSVNELAATKRSNDPIRTALWQVLFNKPSVLVLYTDELTDNLFGVIKYALTHGIKIALKDAYSGFSGVIAAITNVDELQLFKLHKVEQLYNNLPEQPAKIQDAVVQKYEALETLRQSYMAIYVWPEVNARLYELSRFYSLDKQEKMFERICLAQRYAVLDKFEQYAASGMPIKIKLKDLDDKSNMAPSPVKEAMLQTLSVWAPAFGIDIKITKQDIGVESYYLSKNLFLTDYTLRKTTERKLKLDYAPNHELIDAYMQVCYYREQGAEEYLVPGYFICDRCKRPVRKSARYNEHDEEKYICDYCDAEYSIDAVETTADLRLSR